MRQITFVQVNRGTIVKSDYAEGTVKQSGDNTVVIDWKGEGQQSYTWEEVREYGFTFYYM